MYFLLHSFDQPHFTCCRARILWMRISLQKCYTLMEMCMTSTGLKIHNSLNLSPFSLHPPHIVCFTVPPTLSLSQCSFPSCHDETTHLTISITPSRQGKWRHGTYRCLTWDRNRIHAKCVSLYMLPFWWGKARCSGLHRNHEEASCWATQKCQLCSTGQCARRIQKKSGRWKRREREREMKGEEECKEREGANVEEEMGTGRLRGIKAREHVNAVVSWGQLEGQAADTREEHPGTRWEGGRGLEFEQGQPSDLFAVRRLSGQCLLSNVPPHLHVLFSRLTQGLKHPSIYFNGEPEK